MRGSLLILISLLVISLNSAAQQRGLEFTKHRNARSKFIYEGSKMRVAYGDSTARGRLLILSDSAILVQGDTIRINQVRDFRIKSTTNKIVGGTMTVVGTFLLGGGLMGIAELAAEGGALGVLIGVFIMSPFYLGGSMISTSGILLLTVGKKYSNTKWAYKIIDR